MKQRILSMTLCHMGIIWLSPGKLIYWTAAMVAMKEDAALNKIIADVDQDPESPDHESTLKAARKKSVSVAAMCAAQFVEDVQAGSIAILTFVDRSS